MKEDNILKCILRDVENSKIKYKDNYGLLSGLTGNLLFLVLYSKINKNYKLDIENEIDYIFSSIENNEAFSSYCAGISGVCLGIDYIYKVSNLSDYKPFDFVSDSIDKFITEEFIKNLNEQNLDFLHGATGIAFYFLERVKAGDKEFYSYLSLFIKHLKEKSITKNDTITWELKTNKEKFNISLSHGMSSIIIFLCEAYGIDEKLDLDIIVLLKGASNYILKQKIDSEKYGSIFPNTSKQSINIKSRLAWCYGDLGVAIGLLKAAQTLNDDFLLNEVLQIFDFNLKRKDLDENYVYDTSICHGTSGISIIYKYVYNLYKNPQYLEASNYWKNKTLNLYEEDKIFYLVDRNKYDKDRISFLEGKTGIALGILYAKYDINNDWLKFLLL